LLAGDDGSDPAAGFLDIALVAGDEVDMGMGYGLAAGGMDIDPNIESVGVELPLEDGFDLIQEDKAVRLLLEGQVKVIGAMPGGDHQGMPLAHRELIKNGINHRGFRNQRPIRWESTEGTRGRLVHAGGLTCFKKISAKAHPLMRKRLSKFGPQAGFVEEIHLDQGQTVPRVFHGLKAVLVPYATYNLVALVQQNRQQTLRDIACNSGEEDFHGMFMTG